MRPHRNMPEVLHYLWLSAPCAKWVINFSGGLRENIFKAWLGFYKPPLQARTASLRLSPRQNVPHPRTATSGVHFVRQAYG